MVYIPWSQMGICKYWMLQRCFSGDRCKWRHPEPKERKALWDYHTAKQIEDEAKGIPPPKKPTRMPPDNANEAFGSSRLMPVPPPPAGWPSEVPADLPQASHTALSSSDDITARHDPGWPAPWIAQSHGERALLQDAALPVEHDRNIDDRRADDVSMLDAPPSPKNDHHSGSAGFFSSEANSQPLGRPNRLHHVREDGSQFSGVFKAFGLESERFGPPDQNSNVVNVLGSAFSPDVPGAGAVTLWRRGEQDTTQRNPVMNPVEAPRSSSSYWERMRQLKVDGGASKVENRPAEEKVNSDFTRPINSWDFQQPTYNIAPTFSPPSLGNTPPAMGATKRLSNGETKHVGPHPSTIRVSAPYLSQAAISKKLQQVTSQNQLDVQERSIAEAREDTIRLQGVGWIDNVRRSLQLPIRTYTTACVYFHKFRLAYAGGVNGVDYSNAWADACAAALLTSCKVEDTLKKSRDILAAAYNLKANAHDQLGADDAVFEGPSRVVIGLERLVLEAGGFDFRSKYPHRLLIKLAKSLPEGEDGEREKVGKVAWTVLTDLYRTFAPLKHTRSTMALASLELASHLAATSTQDNTSTIRDALQQIDFKAWSTSREEIMETILDLLDLYTQHTSQTILGSKYSLDDFLRIRLAFNKECNESNIPRYTTVPPSDRSVANGSTLRVANGHPTPVSPMEPGPQAQPHSQNTNGTQATPEGGGTLRFMLNPELAADEKSQVQKYFIEEWEEYEEEVPIPQPRQPSREREADREQRDRDHARDRERTSRDGPIPPPPRADRSDRDSGRPREERDRTRDRDREREAERERARARDAERDRRYGADRRYDERKDRRYDDRRYEDDRRRSHGRR